MHLKMKWNKVLNPDQTPVDVSDQPICALTKELRFRQSEFFTRYLPMSDNFVLSSLYW